MAKLVKQAPILVNNLLVASKPKLATFLKYAKVELTPPTPGEIPAALTGVKNLIAGAKNGNWKRLTVREAWLNTLVTVEVICWFYIGECIGKRHIVGYKV